MTLDDYLTKHDITEAAFGAVIDKSQAAVNRYRTGKRRPAGDTLAKIAVASKGKVQPADFFPEVPKKFRGAQAEGRA
jgi:transcriptional regulator with XRE-family HTH domain